MVDPDVAASRLERRQDPGDIVLAVKLEGLGEDLVAVLVFRRLGPLATVGGQAIAAVIDVVFQAHVRRALTQSTLGQQVNDVVLLRHDPLGAIEVERTRVLALERIVGDVNPDLHRRVSGFNPRSTTKGIVEKGRGRRAQPGRHHAPGQVVVITLLVTQHVQIAQWLTQLAGAVVHGVGRTALDTGFALQLAIAVVIAIEPQAVLLATQHPRVLGIELIRSLAFTIHVRQVTT
ncbi:hypothetical protein D3C73_1118170 [compost metagenome]